ncbi:hypothetical protein HRI_004137100 [Hibiscus trionum]|uniref:rRNA N-glycosylase n=1 Tax=Hibiscus trionum TaxID=183268 RepID=A0A9W7J3I2_HIBTR|nr:hypothetical protein HRI_004137100 [Hibiscus trionum]
MKVEQTMKVLAVVAVVLACWASTVESQRPYNVRFTVTDATQRTYGVFINNILNALKVHGSASHGIPVLPSTRDLAATNIQRYVVVEVAAGVQQYVSLVIDATDVYVLGYRPGALRESYFFSDVPLAVRNLFFQGTTRTVLRFDGSYGALQGQAGANRDRIPLGFGELRQRVIDLNRYKPDKQSREIARALIVCLQMVSEATRFKYIQQQIAALAPVVPGPSTRTLTPDTLMQGYQNNWGQLSTAVQTATPNGAFQRSVTVTPRHTYNNVASVRPVIAILKRFLPRFSATAPLDQIVDEELN